MRPMLSSLKKLLSPPPFREEAHASYLSLVAQARQPFFYSECRVPDTLDGRFDVIVLHLFLVVQRLREEKSPEAQEFARVLQEVFFSDMDRSVREMGVSDTGVGKRIKKMAQAFYGRMQAYETGLVSDNALAESLSRNVYRGQAADVSVLVAYVRRIADCLRGQDIQSIMRGEVRFIS